MNLYKYNKQTHAGNLSDGVRGGGVHHLADKKSSVIFLVGFSIVLSKDYFSCCMLVANNKAVDQTKRSAPLLACKKVRFSGAVAHSLCMHDWMK